MGLVQKAFSDIITFSRSSNATRVGPTGRVEYAPHNLLLYSEQFDNAAWTKDAPAGDGTSTITANVAAAPNGTITADRWQATIGTSLISRLYQAVILQGNQPAVISVYLKSNTSSSQSIQLREGYSTASISATVTTTWQRFTLPFTVVAGGNVEFQTAIFSGSCDILVWGAQLSVGPYPLDYTPTTSAAVYGPRFDYDPVTLAARGLLIEEQRTNVALYSEQFDVAYWAKTGASVTANAIAAPDGTVTADKLVENTSLAAHAVYNFGILTFTAAAYTASAYIKAGGRNFVEIALYDGTVNAKAWFNLSTGAVGTLSGGATASITSMGNGWYRCSATATMTAASGGFAIYSANADGVDTYTGDGASGIYAWGAQLEAGSFATSYIPSLASSVTRSADVASVNTLSPWYNATEGTLFAEHQAIYPSQGNVVASINDNSANRAVELQHRGSTPSTQFASFTVVSGSITGQADAGGSSTFSAVRKWAGAYKANDFAASQNGGTVGTDTSGALPTSVTQMQLMAAYWGSSASSSGWLRRLAYYPRRLTNAELQALTA